MYEITADILYSAVGDRIDQFNPRIYVFYSVASVQVAAASHCFVNLINWNVTIFLNYFYLKHCYHLILILKAYL